MVIAYIIWYGGGLGSLFALFLLFTLGSLASAWKKSTKIHYNLAQENHGKRGLSNVLANSGIALILAMVSIVFPEHQNAFRLMIISSFATACSDTFSSEFGNIYGKKYFNIINFKKTQRGIDGAISIQGLGFGVIGSFLIALSCMFFGYDFNIVILITICGLLGNIMDSILGATLQQKGYINNHHVNFFATGFGALFALIFLLFS